MESNEGRRGGERRSGTSEDGRGMAGCSQQQVDKVKGKRMQAAAQTSERYKRLYMFNRSTNEKSAGDYEVIKVTADSGASDHVAPLTTAKHIRLEETERSRNGTCYQAAKGEKIYNRGQRNIKAVTNEGGAVAMTWQVADIKRPLASIGRM